MTGTVRPDNHKKTQQKPYIEQENCDAMNHLIAVGVIWSVFVCLNLEMNWTVVTSYSKIFDFDAEKLD